MSALSEIKNPGSKIFQVATACALLLAIALLSSGPVADGDFWWQIAYGQYMVEHKTLILDHSIYNWTDTNAAWIYCAWVAEIILYYAHQLFGIYGGAFFRYLSMLAPGIVLLFLTRYRNFKLNYAVWFYLFICYSISRHAGGLIKPELFSHLLFAIIVGLYFAIKTDKTNSVRLIYALPLVLVLWINTHAGFIIGMFFIGLAVIGEGINYLLKAEPRLSPAQWRAIAICIPLSALVLLCTPYGYHYPVQLIGEFIGGDHSSAYEHVSAYNSIYSETFAHLGVRYYAAIGVVLLLPLLAEAFYRKRADYALVFINVLMFGLSATWGRFSYFSPVLLFFTFAYLLSHSELWARFEQKRRLHAIGAIASIATILLVAFNTYQNKANGDARGAPFGHGYLNPVSETQYIREHFAGENICNGYNGGGYLLWALGPEQKIMIDPRYFPFADWYQTWIDLTTTSTPVQYLENFDCDVWVLNHTYDTIIRGMVDSKQWRLLYMGSSSAVFEASHADSPDLAFEIDEEVAEIRSLPRQAHILNVLLRMGEYQLAQQLTRQAKIYWAGTMNEPRAIRLHQFIQATTFFKAGDDRQAYPLYKAANQDPGVLKNLSRQRLSGQYLTERLWRDEQYAQALQVAEEVSLSNKNDVISAYNLGFLGLLNDTRRPSGSQTTGAGWQSHLESFLELSKDHSGLPPQYLVHAKQMLTTGVAVNAPPLVPAARAPFSESKHGKWLYAP